MAAQGLKADLYAALYDRSLPLPARLDATRELIAMQQTIIDDLREAARDLVATTPLDDDLTATLYWEYEDLAPTSMLGSNYHQMRKMLDEHCPYTYPCNRCGVDQRVTSRSNLRLLQSIINGTSRRGDAGAFTCNKCRWAKQSERSAEWAQQQEAHRRRLVELKTMPYREYLLTPEWRERRKVRLKAARYACQVCNGRNKPLNVHHRTYERRGDEYARDLIVLCEDCHYLFHRNGSLAPHDHDED